MSSTILPLPQGHLHSSSREDTLGCATEPQVKTPKDQSKDRASKHLIVLIRAVAVGRQGAHALGQVLQLLPAVLQLLIHPFELDSEILQVERKTTTMWTASCFG